MANSSKSSNLESRRAEIDDQNRQESSSCQRANSEAHSLGVVAAFRSKKKALRFLDEYFKTNQGQSPDSLDVTEIKLTA